MENTNQLQEIKNRLIKDLIAGITYVPDRQSDIFTMMRTYKSDFIEQDQKENILKNLANCINNLPYEEPLRLREYAYTQQDIEEFSVYLDQLINKLENSSNPQSECGKAWKEIHALNESKGYGFFDTLQKNYIQRIMNEACEPQAETQTFGMQMM